MFVEVSDKFLFVTIILLVRIQMTLRRKETTLISFREWNER